MNSLTTFIFKLTKTHVKTKEMTQDKKSYWLQCICDKDKDLRFYLKDV